MKPKKAPPAMPTAAVLQPRSLWKLFRHGMPWVPRPEDPAAASVALALTLELLRGLRERGLLTADGVEELLDDAARRFEESDRKASHLTESVRVSLRRKDDE